MNKSKRIKSIIFLTFILISTLISYNCERDDICAESTPTTPRLLVEFYDATEQDELKSVTRLTAYGEDLADNPTDENTEGTLIFNTNARAIELPLFIGVEGETTISRFILEKDTNLRLNDNPNNNSNIDIIEIEYTTEFKYVSRACGYKSVFNLIDVEINPDGDDDDLWIESEEIIEILVENENTVHVHIFH
ncbi:DUF6452 family protein [Winogradskyella algicola]|uniref:DUF6452 family protein n=1 Tax=Winogradskyella algicola TaxID=2575815 RepID=UPI001109CBA3|nr:DUF6452 family protein [Winogradskyella algicola]